MEKKILKFFITPLINDDVINNTVTFFFLFFSFFDCYKD